HLKADIEQLETSSDLEVIIHSIDLSTKRITVKTKEQKINHISQKEQIWKATVKKYKKGDWVNGIVQKEVEFGYFIKMETGVEGLLHKNWIKSPNNILLKEAIRV